MPVACCFLCGASFGVSASLNRHLKEVHNHEIVQKEKCSQCEYVGKHQNLLNHISIVHGEKFNCDMCDKPFQGKANLNRHIKNKHDFKVYLCPVCNASYSRKEYLDSHMKSHISYKCTSKMEYARPDKVLCCDKWMRQAPLHIP